MKWRKQNLSPSLQTYSHFPDLLSLSMEWASTSSPKPDTSVLYFSSLSTHISSWWSSISSNFLRVLTSCRMNQWILLNFTLTCALSSVEYTLRWQPLFSDLRGPAFSPLWALATTISWQLLLYGLLCASRSCPWFWSNPMALNPIYLS